MIKKALSLLILTLIVTANLAFCLPSEAAAPNIPPKPTTDIFVQDQAGVLSEATKQHILQTSEALSQATGAQAVVLTVKTLGDTPVEDYALAVLRGWGIGDKDKNNGVLLLVATQDHKMRIEVGYGLEGAIPDGKAGSIMDELIIPSFKTNDFDTGITAGYDAIIANVAAESGYAIDGVVDQTGTSDQATSYQDTPQQPSWFSLLPGWLRTLLIIIAVILVIGLFIIDNMFLGGFLTNMLIILISMIGRGGRGGGSGGGGGSSFGGGSGGGGGASRSW